MNTSIENIVFTEFTKKNVFGQLTSLKMSLTQKRNYVKSKSASFVVIGLLHEGHIHLQKKPKLHLN